MIFEDEDGAPAPVEAEQLSALLREHRIPMMVLNACQSATHAEDAEDVFASVATALRAGVRSVVAMAYSLYVSGGRVFLPAFYRRLFESGNPSEAVRAGRQHMFQDKKRVSARGPYPLADWLVPVLYQLEAPDMNSGEVQITHALRSRPSRVQAVAFLKQLQRVLCLVWPFDAGVPDQKSKLSPADSQCSHLAGCQKRLACPGSPSSSNLP